MKRTVVALALLLWLPASNAVGAPASAPVDQSPLTNVRGRDGFWRVGRDATGAWWFVSPDGRREFLNCVTTVQPFQGGRDRGADARFVSADWDLQLTDNTLRLSRWAAATAERIEQTGFKGVGAWSHPALHALDVPMTRDLNLWTWVPWGSRRVFSPGFAPAIEAAVREQVASLRDNRNLVGYYLDNELDWTDASAGPAAYFDLLPVGDANRAEVLAVVRTLWPDVTAFNAAWGTSLASWDDLAAAQRLPHQPQAAYGKLYSAWLSHVARTYFRTTTALLRRHDPNHLVLGVRFRGVAPAEVVAASREFTDAQSINYYSADAKLDEQMFRAMHELSGGQPVIVTEYAFHSLDNRSGARNTFGFVAQVPDQQARADGYRLLTTRLASVPFVIGADWFQWMDEPPSGRGGDGEDVNFGVVDIDDRAYELLAAAVRETTPLLNGLHATSTTAPRDDVWRKPVAGRPAARVPYLASPVRVNGDLGDWPTDAALSGVRHVATVGLDRLAPPPPTVRLGWTLDGLYVALEVFDDDVVGAAPAGGAWWTRDSVEFFVATRAAGPAQTDYDSACHSFFFIPTALPGADGKSGTLGQWHRAGDTLKGHLIPHPAVRQATRVLRDRYVVEMFIPAAALSGFDPAQQPRMAFNVVVRDFQASVESFWSAPKDAHTHLRPSTWGTLELAAPEAKPLTTEPVADTGVEGITK